MDDKRLAQKNKKEAWVKIFGVIRYLLVFIFSFLSIYYVCKGEQELFQVPKDLGFYQGCLFFCILLFIIRKISIKKIEVWLTLTVGIIAVLLYFRLKDISPSTYGKDYYRVVLFPYIIGVLSISLLADLIRGRGKEIFKRINWFGILLICVFGWAVINKNTDIVPLLFPMVALYTTIIEEDEWLIISDLFILAFYIVFVIWMVNSYLNYGDKYSAGRFIGAFLREDTGGPICGGAIVSGLYFIGRFTFSKAKKWYKLFLGILMTTIPIFITLKMGCRSSLFGLAFAILLFIVFFVGKKSPQRLVIRGSIALAVFVLIIVMVFSIAYISAKQMENGTYDGSKHGYLYNHIAVLVHPSFRSGYFGEDSILNALDSFSSERLKIWDASLKLVEPMGKPYEGIYIEWNNWGGCGTAHSFFVEMLVEYGGIGGTLVILCYLLAIALAAVKCAKRNKSTILTLLWTSFCLGPFIGISLYWKATVSFILLIILYPLCFKERNIERKREE